MLTRIHAARRPGSALTCAFCRDAVRGGTTCSGCQAVYHRDCARTLGRCGTLGCRVALERRGGRAVRPERRGPAPAPRHGKLRLMGIALLTWTLLAAAMNYPFGGLTYENRKAANEEYAERELKNLVVTQELFRQGRDGDCCPPGRYGTLAELGGNSDEYCDKGADCSRRDVLIDPWLAKGTRNGYVFEIQPSKEPHPLSWIATARPALPTTTGDRYFAINQAGVLFEDEAVPFETTLDASIRPKPVGGD